MSASSPRLPLDGAQGHRPVADEVVQLVLELLAEVRPEKFEPTSVSSHGRLEIEATVMKREGFGLVSALIQACWRRDLFVDPGVGLRGVESARCADLSGEELSRLLVQVSLAGREL